MCRPRKPTAQRGRRVRSAAQVEPNGSRGQWQYPYAALKQPAYVVRTTGKCRHRACVRRRGNRVGSSWKAGGMVGGGKV